MYNITIMKCTDDERLRKIKTAQPCEEKSSTAKFLYNFHFADKTYFSGDALASLFKIIKGYIQKISEKRTFFYFLHTTTVYYMSNKQRKSWMMVKNRNSVSTIFM